MKFILKSFYLFLADANWNIVETFLPQTEKTPDASIRTQDMLSDIRLRVLDKEKQLTRKLYAEGAISPYTFRRLVVSLDEQYDHDGKMQLSVRKSIFSYYTEPFYIQWLKKIPYVKSWLDRYFHEWVINGYDLGRGFIITQRESQKVLSEFATSEVLNEGKKLNLEGLEDEISKNISIVEGCLEDLAKEYPISYRCALTRKAVRMLLSNEWRTISQLVSDGLLSEKDAEQMKENIDDRYSGLSTFKINRLLKDFKNDKA